MSSNIIVKNNKATANIGLTNKTIKDIVIGEDNKTIEALSKEFQVRISKKAQNQNPLHIVVKGPASTAQAAMEFIELLVKYAGDLIEEYSIASPREISPTIRRHFTTELTERLQARRDDRAKAFKAKQETQAANQNINPAIISHVEVANDFAVARDVAKKKPANLPIPLKEDFTPRNQSQATAFLAMKDPNVSVIFLAGPAGGGKTYPALRAAFELFNEKQMDSILMFRPRTVTGAEKFGATPGNEMAKMGPYLKALSKNIAKMTGKKLGDLKMIEALTPDFERGETYDKSIILVDEAQNLTINEAELLITRIGEGAKIIFAGDIGGRQNDLRGQFPGLTHLIAAIGHAAQDDHVLAAGSAFIRYTEDDTSARNKLMPNITKALGGLSEIYNNALATLAKTKQNPDAAAAMEVAINFAKGELAIADERTRNYYENNAKSQYPALYGIIASKSPELRIVSNG